MKHKVINMKTSTLIILAVICAIIFIAPLAMYNGHGEDDGYFGGEIESLLFALQAAIGAIIIGYFFGYWRGQGKEE